MGDGLDPIPMITQPIRNALATLLLLVGTSLPLRSDAVTAPKPAHGLRFDKPIKSWDEALPLGNGILGGLVWGDGRPLRISLDRTDLWDLTPVAEFFSKDYTYRTVQEWHSQGRHADLVRMIEDPYNRPAPTKIPAGRIELQIPGTAQLQSTRLDLRGALTTTHFTDGSDVEIFIHAEQPIGVIRVRGGAGSRGDLAQLVPPRFAGQVKNAASGGIGAGDLTQLGYAAGTETRGDGWQAFRQPGAGGFHFAAYLGWREVGGEWLGVWAISSSLESANPLDLAKSRVDRALASGWVSLLRSHQEWWEAYWQKSGVEIPNAVIEREWYLDQYKFGAASRRGAPPITLQGPWTADNGQLPPWKGDYHHDLNTELSYWPCYSANHLEEGLSYLDWLWQTRSNCVAWTRRFFDLPGLNVPMTADLDNNQIGGWRQYTHSATTAAWLAQHFYWHWKYSADPDFLQSRAWPYLREASVFIEAVTANRRPDGKRTLPLSASPEIHDNRPTAWFKELTNYDLSLMRWLLEATAELADATGNRADARHWRQVHSEMPALALGEDGSLLVAPGESLKESHRHFSHLMAIHPLGLLDPRDGDSARRTIETSLRDLDRLGSSQWCGYSFAWLASLHARALDGDRAARALEIFASAFTLPNSFHANGDQSGKGYSNFKYRPFTLEGNFASAAGLQEMLLQSHRGRIEVFPAIPASWKNARFNSLRAQGAFLVSAERSEGTVRKVEILAERGGELVLLSPFSGTTLRIHTRPGQRLVFTKDPPKASLWEKGKAATRDHRFSTLFTAQDVRNLSRSPTALAQAIDWCKQTAITRVYVETFRDGYQADREALQQLTRTLRESGLEVAGCVTPTQVGKGSSRWNIIACYTDIPTQDRLQKIFEFTAGLFDEIMIDDFWFTECACADCDTARKARTVRVGLNTYAVDGDTWEDYRRTLMGHLSEDRVLAAAKRINPNARLIIKYPQWYDTFHERGYDVLGETRIFDKTWVGTEVRDYQDPKWGGTVPYEAYFIMRWLGGIGGAKCGGGWYDYLGTTPATYLEQARQTVLAGAKESMLFHYGGLQSGTGPGDIQALRTAIPDLLQTAREVQRRQPIGIAAYKPGNSHPGDERRVFDFIGMLGLPLVPCHEFPDQALAAFFSIHALKDPTFPEKLARYIVTGRPVLLTEGLAAKLPSTINLHAGNVHRINTGKDPKVLLAMSQPEIDTLRASMLAPFHVTFSGPNSVGLYLYADGSWVVENFNDESATATLNGRKFTVAARDWRTEWR